MADSVQVTEHFNAPLEKVWSAVTDINEMNQWLFPQLASFEARPGFKTAFTMTNDGKDFIHLWEVTDVKPKQLITVNWKYEGYPGEAPMTMQLEPDGDKTTFTLTHEGFNSYEPAKHPELASENFQQGWDHLIRISLKEHLEKK